MADRGTLVTGGAGVFGRAGAFEVAHAGAVVATIELRGAPIL